MSYLYQTPIKMPRGLHYGSDYWIAHSYKLNRKVCLFSMLEYANFIELEMNPAVEYYCEQPLKIEEQNIERKQSSVFDFWVYFINGQCEFQEIKYTTELSGDSETAKRSQKQIEFQKTWCKSNNFTYKIITEQDLLNSPFRSSNLQILQSHLMRNEYLLPGEHTKLLQELLKTPLSLGDIKNFRLLPQGDEMAILAHLVYSGKIQLNLNDRPIDNNTEVMLCEIKSTTF